MSATIVSPRSTNRLSSVTVSAAPSEPMSLSNCAPIRASASCISMADRPPLPSSSISTEIAASPSLPGGSLAEPRLTRRMHVTTGTETWRTVHTRRPFGSCDFSMAGNTNGRPPPGSGRRERSIRTAGAVTRQPPRPTRDRQLGAAARDDAQRDAPVRPQMSGDGLPHRRRGRVLIAREIAVEELGLADEDVVGVELIGFTAEAADCLQSKREMRFGLSATALDLLVGRAVRRQMRDLLEDRVLELGERVAGRRRGGELQEAADLAGVLRRRHVGGDAPVEDEAPIQPRRLAVGEA